MLHISNCVIDKINRECKDINLEQGWLIGCKRSTECIEDCCLLPSSYADDNCYVLDSVSASQVIRKWAADGVCVIGFVHSHLHGDGQLSHADIDSANRLLNNLKMPFLYIGIVVSSTNNEIGRYFPLYMYLISGDRMSTRGIEPIPYICASKNTDE